MSQKTEIICDRCGEEITAWDVKEVSAKIHLWGIGVPRSYGGQRIDLCAECYHKFVEFIESDDTYEQRKAD